MLSVQIKRRQMNDVDAKQVLRAHVEQMPIEKQREFVAEALRLMGRRGQVPAGATVAEPKLLN